MNLGASIHLLPYSLYKRLGLGELKTTRKIIQLANHSTRTPVGVGENVLIAVGDIIFPMDLVVLKTRFVTKPNA